MRPVGETCATCLHFMPRYHPTPGVELPDSCHRAPPVLLASPGIAFRFVWPEVRPDEWCGQFSKTP